MDNSILGLPTSVLCSILMCCDKADALRFTQSHSTIFRVWQLSKYMWMAKHNPVTCLQHVACTGMLEALQELLDQGVNASQGHALILAGRHGHTRVVDLLLSRGANAHTLHDAALWMAAGNGHLLVVNSLTQRGAVEQLDVALALCWATHFGQTTVVSYLLSVSPQLRGCVVEVPSNLSQMLPEITLKIMPLPEQLVEQAVSPSSLALPSSTYLSLLPYAVNGNHHHTADLLLIEGADINEDGCMVLCQAAGLGYTKMVQLLLNKGADVHANKGQQALY